jgi:ribokinase
MSVLVFGSANADLVFPTPTLPAPGHTVLGESWRASPGGKGANQATAAARAGAATASASAVGTDALAEVALSGMVAAGVDLARLARVGVATGAAAICVDAGGANQISVASGANMAVRAGQVEEAALTAATVLLLQMEVPVEEMAALVRRARAAGARIILNLAPPAPVPETMLRQLDLLVANEHEAAWLAGRLGVAAEAVALRGALGIDVVVTRGENGAEAATAPARTTSLPSRPWPWTPPAPATAGAARSPPRWMRAWTCRPPCAGPPPRPPSPWGGKARPPPCPPRPRPRRC